MDESIISTFRKWAIPKPYILRCWIFGSRARGDHRPDSDLDVAIEIRGIGLAETPFSSFSCYREIWRKELEHSFKHIFEHQIHLAHYNPQARRDIPNSDRKIFEEVDGYGVLVYCKEQVTG
jgi:predicted nucleotidyltransferase